MSTYRQIVCHGGSPESNDDSGIMKASIVASVFCLEEKNVGILNWVSDAADWVSDKAGSAYDSVKSGTSYITGITARDNYKRADRIVKNAKWEFEEATETLEKNRVWCSTEFEELGKLRLKLEDGQMRRFVEVIKPITNVEYKQLKLEEFSGDLTVPSLQTIEVSSYQASDLLKDGIQAVSVGTLAGVGALGVVTTFGTASTGTAISALSGAAATNATLAWLGGGSLAAGGLGVAGGTAVLGGIVAVPLLLVFASRATAKSEEALTQAFEQEAQYEVATEEVKLLVAKTACVIARTQEVFETTVALSKRFEALLSAMEGLVAQKSEAKTKLAEEAEASRARYARRFFLLRWIDKLFRRVPTFCFPDPLDFHNFTELEKNSYLMTVNFGFGLYSILKVKIIEDSGSIAPESEEAISVGQILLGEVV